MATIIALIIIMATFVISYSYKANGFECKPKTSLPKEYLNKSYEDTLKYFLDTAYACDSPLDRSLAIELLETNLNKTAMHSIKVLNWLSDVCRKDSDFLAQILWYMCLTLLCQFIMIAFLIDRLFSFKKKSGG